MSSDTNTTQLTLPVLPLHNGVVFPHMVVTIKVETEEGRTAIEAAQSADGRLLMVPRIDGAYASVGTVGTIQQVDEDGDVVVNGLRRARVGAGSVDESGALWVAADEYPEVDIVDPELQDLVAEYRAVVTAVLENRGMAGIAERLLDMESPSRLADLAVYSPDLSLEQKVELLEALDIRHRLGLLIEWMTEVLADMELRRKVREDATERIEKGQREYILRQQLEAIRKELGDDEDVASGYRAKLAETDFPPAVAETVEREIDRLERMSEQSPEHSWIRTWLDTMFDVPWGKTSDDRLELPKFGRFSTPTTPASRTSRSGSSSISPCASCAPNAASTAEAGRQQGAILLLVGPPGVGKTSLGESVARAMGREFVRVALGGLRDEAEIRGHRRTYVGARPGRVVRALIEAGTMNPVFLLDEMDKVGADWRGDPSSALLEVLDPAQNHTFRDNYLEVDLDLSNILFIATANVLETIPAPLLDRTEVIRIDGYTDDEKVAIARDHLLPRQLRAAGLDPEELTVDEEALASIVDRYTREAGVRALERELGKLTRKVATRIARGDNTYIDIGADQVGDYLGKPKVWKDEASDRTDVPGVATGLAVTGAGGDVLFIEATSMQGDPELTLTGQLGDVMKESARIALSYVESHAAELGIDRSLLESRVHLHVPAGAIPKDGPSAGIAMLTALASLFTGKRVRANVGMTGEITLQGKVLPIGGVKQKVLAAHRAGLSEVVLPRRNEIDLDDLPEAIRDQITFHIVDTADDVIAAAIES
jgi:ATP-dependent Lon protease